MKIFFLIYLLITNLISLLLMLFDKRKAIKHKWRISEKTLLSSSIIGGSIGTFLGMYFFRHKTNNLKFKIGVPFIIIIQASLYVIFFT